MAFGKLMRFGLAACAVLLVVFSLLGFLSPVFWGFGLLEHFRVQYALTAVLGGLITWAFTMKRSALVFLGVVTLNTCIVAGLFFGKAPLVGKDGDLRLVSYNVWRRGGDIDSIHRCLDFYQPDVAYLSEMDTEKTAAIDGEFERYGGGADILLVRKGMDIEVLEVQESPDDLGSGLLAHLTFQGRPIRLLAVHLPIPFAGENAAARDRIFNSIATWVREQTDPVILVGDLNATPWSASFRKFEEDSGLKNSQAGFGLQPTWPTHSPRPWRQALLIPIDHCLHSNSLATFDRKVGMAGSSNHRALFLQLRLPR